MKPSAGTRVRLSAKSTQHLAPSKAWRGDHTAGEHKDESKEDHEESVHAREGLTHRSGISVRGLDYLHLGEVGVATGVEHDQPRAPRRGQVLGASVPRTGCVQCDVRNYRYPAAWQQSSRAQVRQPFYMRVGAPIQRRETGSAYGGGCLGNPSGPGTGSR